MGRNRYSFDKALKTKPSTLPIHLVGFPTFPTSNTLINPFFLEKASTLFVTQVMFVTSEPIDLSSLTGGDTWQKSSCDREHQMRTWPSALPTAMNVPSGLMETTVGSPRDGSGRVDAILYMRREVMISLRLHRFWGPL